MCIVADAFGFGTDDVLGIVGGGGTARSVRQLSELGGKITQIGGKRILDEEGPWDLYRFS